MPRYTKTDGSRICNVVFQKAWINSHGNDGRYSLPLNDFIEQIKTQKNS